MPYRFARRSHIVTESVFGEIMKYLQDPEIISFSGGFPASRSFPVKALEDAASKVFKEDGVNALQYSATGGYLPLRQWIADRYMKRIGLSVDPANILITTGSQQALDLIAKSFIDPGDDVIVEYPSYLGALQSLAVFEPIFHEVNLNEDGLDLDELKLCLDKYNPKLLYTVPNFQNPTGISYSKENRLKLCDLVKNQDLVIIEDDPYGELRYLGEELPLLKSLLPDQVILMGSFSKIISPGMRLGWVIAHPEIFDKLYNAKEASDLHASTLDQRIIYQYLSDNDLDAHLSRTKTFYAKQRQKMAEAMEIYFPKEVRVAASEGGMFFWVTLPKGISSTDLFFKAVEKKVLYVPGDPFYVSAKNMNTLRLNYTSANPDQIEEGILRLAEVFKEAIELSE